MNLVTKIKHSLRATVLTANYLTYKDIVWIVGDGRSGTTWLSELINYDERYRDMFEPFHPTMVDRAKNIGFFKYIRPEDEDKSFYKLAREVFTGRLQDQRVGSQNKKLFYKGLLIKDIFANLFVKWVDTHFPEVKKILLMRHPFAVALSKQKLRHWHWMTEPKEFLDRQELYEDYLQPFENLIRRTDGYFEKQVVIWSIIHYVSLNQLNEQDILLVFYEELCTEPERELKRVFSYLYGSTSGQFLNPKILARIKIPSSLSREDSAIKQGKSLLDVWCNELSESEINKGIAILRSFGLDRIYNDSLMPDREAAELFLRD